MSSGENTSELQNETRVGHNQVTDGRGTTTGAQTDCSEHTQQFRELKERPEHGFRCATDGSGDWHTVEVVAKAREIPQGTTDH